MEAQVKTKKPPKKAKVERVTQIKEKFEKSNVVVLTDYSGLSVTQLTVLRKQLRKANAEFRVYKNTLTKIGLKGREITELTEVQNGQNAYLFGFDDPVTPVKMLAKFIKDNEKPVIKGGIMDNKFLNEADVKALSKLPSKEELIAKVVGGIKSPLYGIVNVLAGTMKKLLYALNAVKDQKAQK